MLTSALEALGLTITSAPSTASWQLGGLALLARGGGAYYLLGGLACAGVGALLMRCSRWALALQALAVLAALAWAWRGGSVLLAVLQAAPLWLAALWAAVPAVREPLR